MSHKESFLFCLVDESCGDYILHQKGKRFLIFWGFFESCVYLVKRNGGGCGQNCGNSSAFLLDNDMDIYLVVFDNRAAQLGGKLYPDLEAYIDQKYVRNKREEEYSVGRWSEQQTENRMSMPTFVAAPRALKAAEPAETLDFTEYEAVPDFEKEHESRLEERIRHLSDTFS